MLTDLVIGGDALLEHAPEHVPDVFAGAPVLAALQVKPTGGEIVVRGNLARGTWEQRIQVAAAQPGEGNQAVVKLYGRERVADLEMRWTIGREVQAIDREIESIGLVFQIATRRTSWLAIDDDRTVDPRLGYRQEEIPQELPYGTTMASFGGAQVMAMAMAPAPMAAMGTPMQAMRPMSAMLGRLPPGAGAPARAARPSMKSRAPSFEPPERDEPTLTGAGGGAQDEDETTDMMRSVVRAPAPPARGGSGELPPPRAAAGAPRSAPTTLRAPAPVPGSPPPAQAPPPAPAAPPAQAAPPAPPVQAAIESVSVATRARAVEERAPLPKLAPKRRPWVLLLLAALFVLIALATLAWIWFAR